MNHTSDRPPIRMAHLGLGAFHRAHQAWYTQRATGPRWGIAAFTVRRPDAARALSAQGCAYTLIERGPDIDVAESIEAIVAAHDGSSVEWERILADPAVSVLTVTVTEAGYAPDGLPAARIARALRARAVHDSAPLAIMSCDNLPANGRRLAHAVRTRVDDALGSWIEENVSFVDTVVDRITPATTKADMETARSLTGRPGSCAVVAEPYREWIIAGHFPAARPAWETAGARFVDDVAPFEDRKLWIVNAGHTLLAYEGLLRGHDNVSDAFADPGIRELVEQLWDEQRAVIDIAPADMDGYLVATRARFANSRMRHRLGQIAQDPTAKLDVRILRPMRRRLDRGLAPGEAQRATVNAWARAVARFGATDAAEDELAERARSRPGQGAAESLLHADEGWSTC